MPRKLVCHNDGQSGFTLIELVVVIGIIAIVLVILTVGVRAASDAFALRRAATVIISEARRAQASAVGEAVDYTVEFALLSPYGITVYRQTTATRTFASEWPSGVTIQSAGTTLPSCTTPGNPANACVTFKPLGYVVQGGTVQVLGRTGVQANITIATATGRVSMTP